MSFFKCHSCGGRFQLTSMKTYSGAAAGSPTFCKMCSTDIEKKTMKKNKSTSNETKGVSSIPGDNSGVNFYSGGESGVKGDNKLNIHPVTCRARVGEIYMRSNDPHDTWIVESKNDSIVRLESCSMIFEDHETFITINPELSLILTYQQLTNKNNWNKTNYSRL